MPRGYTNPVLKILRTVEYPKLSETIVGTPFRIASMKTKENDSDLELKTQISEDVISFHGRFRYPKNLT